jgi:filamentous hemagglutinin
MAWIGQLQNDPALQGKIDWAKVEEIHKNWHYDQQGLSPAGATVLTLVVAYFVVGAGSRGIHAASLSGIP